MANVIDDTVVEAGISWGNFMLRGDPASVAEVKRLLVQEERLKWFEREYQVIVGMKIHSNAR